MMRNSKVDGIERVRLRYKRVRRTYHILMSGFNRGGT